MGEAQTGVRNLVFPAWLHFGGHKSKDGQERFLCWVSYSPFALLENIMLISHKSTERQATNGGLKRGVGGHTSATRKVVTQVTQVGNLPLKNQPRGSEEKLQAILPGRETKIPNRKRHGVPLWLPLPLHSLCIQTSSQHTPTIHISPLRASTLHSLPLHTSIPARCTRKFRKHIVQVVPPWRPLRLRTSLPRPSIQGTPVWESHPQ